MKSILITGSSGFIGKYLSKYFLNKNYLVYGISRSSPNNELIKNFTQYFSSKLSEKDLSNLINKCKPDYIFHCAGRTLVKESFNNPSADFKDNTIMTFEFLNMVKNFSPESKIFFFSSAAVYGNPNYLPIDENFNTLPLSPYGFHKMLAEEICREFSEVYSLRIVILRIFSAYGEGLRRQIFYDLMNKFHYMPEVKLKGSGSETRDFIHVFDLCRAIEIIMNTNNNFLDIYNVATGEETSIKGLAEMISEVINSNKKIVFDNIPNQGMPINWRADITKLKKLGFNKAVDISEGIEKYVKWFSKENLM